MPVDVRIEGLLAYIFSDIFSIRLIIANYFSGTQAKLIKSATIDENVVEIKTSDTKDEDDDVMKLRPKVVTSSRR